MLLISTATCSARGPLSKKLKAPPYPELKPVEVEVLIIDGKELPALYGESLDNAVENWLNVHIYIEELIKAGQFKK